MRNFYDHQAQAFARSAKLISLLVLAVVGTVLGTSLALTYGVAVVWYCINSADLTTRTFEIAELFGVICVVAGIFVAAASLFKMSQLRAGGKVIAKDLGGRRLTGAGLNREERRVVNIVEEIAVASGIPVPEVYVLDHQEGINAFAAGYDFEDAIVAVTEGCIRRLSRDQLQGVMAHEFAHILNGDMRINLRLVGALHGILSVSLLAEGLFVAAQEMANAPSNGRDAGNEFLLVILFVFTGILLWPIGLIGTLFGMLVMSATSRQREFLADAYAVQFTRHPEGIAGTLKLLYGARHASRVRTKNCLEASHFFFAQGTGVMAGLLATHPPLDERIRRLDPQWDGVPLFEERSAFDGYDGPYQQSLELLAGAPAKDRAEREEAEDARPQASPAAVSQHPSSVSSSVESADGTGFEPPPTEADQNLFAETNWSQRYAAQLESELPPVWLELVEAPEGIPVVLVGLWLSLFDASTQASAPAGWQKAVEQLVPHLIGFDIAHRTLLLDRVLEQLKQLDATDRAEVQSWFRNQFESTESSSLTLWSWTQQLSRRLGLLPRNETKAKYGKLSQLQQACEVVFSWLCHAGSSNSAMAAYAFQRAVVHLDLHEPEFWEREELDCQKLQTALELLAEAAPHARRQVLIAMGCCIAADQGITAEEAELVRGVCAALDLPVPGLLPGQAVAPGT